MRQVSLKASCRDSGGGCSGRSRSRPHKPFDRRRSLSTPFHKYGNVCGWGLRGEVAKGGGGDVRDIDSSSRLDLGSVALPTNAIVFMKVSTKATSRIEGRGERRARPSWTSALDPQSSASRNTAQTRAGPPDPSSILMGAIMTQAPRRGIRSRLAAFSM